MSELEENNSLKISHISSSIKLSKEVKDQSMSENEIQEDKYNLGLNQISNPLSNKLIVLLEECLLAPVSSFNTDIFKKYDKENLLEKDNLNQIDLKINDFKLSFIEYQFKILKDLIEKYNLFEGLKKLSDEKSFHDELNKLNISADIFSFIGPLNNIINEINDKKNENSKNSYEIEKFFFKILEMNYYKRKTSLLEETIQMLDLKIEDLKNKNKISNC